MSLHWHLSVVLCVLLAPLLKAQPVVAPAAGPEPARQGEEIGPYNVVASFETGYRFRSVGGSLDKYRSDVNFGNGVRLLSGRFSAQSRNGQARWFDSLTITTLGLGNDPYQTAALRAEKNRLYRYQLSWRASEYFNPGFRIAEGQHFMHTNRQLQDHDVEITARPWLTLLGGITRNRQDGPALTTTSFLGVTGNEFPLFMDLRRLRREYRAGGQIVLRGLRWTVLRGWDGFEEDRPTFVDDSAGNDPASPVRLDQMRRAEPYRGSSPYWLTWLSVPETRWLTANLRFSHTAGRSNFVLEEQTRGTSQFGTPRDFQYAVIGTGRRPVTSGNSTISFLPTERLTLTHHFSFHQARMEGDNFYGEFLNGNPSVDAVNFEMLSIRTFSSAVEGSFRIAEPVNMYGGWAASIRGIRSRQRSVTEFAEALQTASQQNRLHSIPAGIRLRLPNGFSASIDAEAGRADRPIFPVSEARFYTLGGRAQYRTRSLTVSGHARRRYNNNPGTIAFHSARGRDYAAQVSWRPRSWIGLDGGYSNSQFETLTGIAYFLDFNLITGDRSFYLSSLHSWNATVHANVGRRATILAGFYRVQDRGDGRTTITGDQGEARLPAFRAVQTFPFSYQAPMGRLSVPLGNRIQWSVGYQRYGYDERFMGPLDYRAHTGYSSLLWSF